MAGVMTKEEPLIKQLVRSRALRPREHSGSPTRGRSPIQKYTVTSNIKSNIKAANIPTIRSMSQPPPINQRQASITRGNDTSRNVYRPPMYGLITDRGLAQYHAMCFSTNQLSEGPSLLTRRQSVTPFDTGVISQNQSLSFSQPNLLLNRPLHLIEAYHPVNLGQSTFSTRCSSISTLPPSSSRCGSPINPALLSPLDRSAPTTPIGSPQKMSLLPMFFQMPQEEFVGNTSSKHIPDIDVSIKKNNSCNSIYSAPEDVFHVEQRNHTFDQQNSSGIGSEYISVCSNQSDIQSKPSSGYVTPIPIQGNNIDDNFTRRGSLLPIFEHLHFNDEINYARRPSQPTHLNHGNVETFSHPESTQERRSNSPDGSKRDRRNIMGPPSLASANFDCGQIAQKIADPVFSNHESYPFENSHTIHYSNPTDQVEVLENDNFHSNKVNSQSTCRDEWSSALEAEREYSFQHNQKYNISDGFTTEEPNQCIPQGAHEEYIQIFPGGNNTMNSENDVYPEILTTQKLYTKNAFASQERMLTAKELGFVQWENYNQNNSRCEMSKEKCCPLSYKNSKKFVHRFNKCANPSCQCINSLYSKICNLLGPYNGADVQKISLFTVSTNIIDCSSSTTSNSLNDRDIISPPSTYVNIPTPAKKFQKETNTEEQHRDEVCLHQAKKRRKSIIDNKR